VIYLPLSVPIAHPKMQRATFFHPGIQYIEGLHHPIETFHRRDRCPLAPEESHRRIPLHRIEITHPHHRILVGIHPHQSLRH
jgi:hypothetical protein